MTRIFDISSTLGTRLMDEQKATFDRTGALHFRNFLNPDGVDALLHAGHEVEAHRLRSDVKVVNGTPVNYGRNLDRSPMVQRFAFANQHHTVLEEFLKHTRFNTLLDRVGGDAWLGKDEKDGLVVNHNVNTSESNFT